MHILLIKHILYWAAVIATPVAGGIALFKGDKAERLGAGGYIVSILVADYCLPLFANLGVDKVQSMAYWDLAFTLGQSIFFLYLALRYGSLWLAAAMAVSGTDFYFDQSYLMGGRANYTVYAIEVDVVCFVVLSLLGAAALWSWRARILRRKDDAKREDAVNRRQEAWAKQYETLLAGRLAEVAAPAPVRNGRAYLTIEPPLP